MEIGATLVHIKDESEMILVVELEKESSIRMAKTELQNGFWRIWLVVRCGAIRSNSFVDLDKAIKDYDEKDMDLIVEKLTDEVISDIKIKNTWS